MFGRLSLWLQPLLGSNLIVSLIFSPPCLCLLFFLLLFYNSLGTDFVILSHLRLPCCALLTKLNVVPFLFAGNWRWEAKLVPFLQDLTGGCWKWPTFTNILFYLLGPQMSHLRKAGHLNSKTHQRHNKYFQLPIQRQGSSLLIMTSGPRQFPMSGFVSCSIPF